MKNKWLFVCVLLALLSGCGPVMKNQNDGKIENFIIYGDQDYYASFPEIIRTKDKLVVLFENQPLEKLKNSVHPHYQPFAEHYFAVSKDNCRSWQITCESPKLTNIQHATRCLLPLPNNELLYVKFRYDKPTTESLPTKVQIYNEGLENCVYEQVLENMGPLDVVYPWDVRKLNDGSILLAGYWRDYTVPNDPIEGTRFIEPWPEKAFRYTMFFLKGSPDGRNWKFFNQLKHNHVFGMCEPNLLVFPDGRIVCVIRSEWARGFGDRLPEGVHGKGSGREGIGYYIYQTESLDGGQTWSQAKQLPIWGHPAYLVQLESGNVLMVYGHRRPPYSIRAILSTDQCRTWDMSTMKTLYTFDPGSYDIGYPVATQLDNGRIFCTFYGYLPDAENKLTRNAHAIYGCTFDERWLQFREPVK